MPELPEVETIRQDLRKKILHKKVRNVIVLSSSSVRGAASVFKRKIINNVFEDINRVGKLLIFVLRGKKEFLLIHLKMTGQLVYADKKSLVAGGHSLDKRSIEAGIGYDLPNSHTRVIFEIGSHGKIYFNDLRRFGYLDLVSEKEMKKIKAGYGIEPLQADFTWQNFFSVIKKRKTSIKALLLNQKIISGIGNIYADEILFAAGVLPNRTANEISEKEAKAIVGNSKRIISQAIKYRGTTFSNYVDSEGKKGNFSRFLQVYGRTGLNCKKCRKNTVKKAKIAGRGTHFCSHCQT